jgi:hypothetical protein
VQQVAIHIPHAHGHREFQSGEHGCHKGVLFGWSMFDPIRMRIQREDIATC